MSELNIRKANDEDIEGLKKLFRETILSVNIKHYNQQQLDAWVSVVNNTDFLKEQVKEQHFFIAEKNSVILGFASITDDGYLDFTFVHKDHQREGVGKTLFTHLLDLAQSLGIDEIYTHASITAKPFFEQQGFTVEGENIAYRKNVELKNYKMVRKVNA